jgi:hypothetical protein
MIFLICVSRFTGTHAAYANTPAVVNPPPTGLRTALKRRLQALRQARHIPGILLEARLDMPVKKMVGAVRFELTTF